MQGHTVKNPSNKYGYLNRRYVCSIDTNINIKPITQDLLKLHNLTNFIVENGLPDGLEIDKENGEIYGKPEYSTKGNDICVTIRCEDTKGVQPDNLVYYDIILNIEGDEESDNYDNYDYRDVYRDVSVPNQQQININQQPLSIDLSYTFKHSEWYFIIVLLFNLFEFTIGMLIYYNVLFEINYGYYATIVFIIYAMNFFFQCRKLNFINNDQIFESIIYLVIVTIINIFVNNVVDNYIKSFIIVYYYLIPIIITCVLFVSWKLPSIRKEFTVVYYIVF